MKAMIFAAGLGTRLKPITDSIPKALLPIGGKTLLEWQLDKLRTAGITDVVINIHHFPEQIVAFCHQLVTAPTKPQFANMHIQFSDESEQLLETGGGLRKAGALLCGGQKGSETHGEEPILVMNVDVLSNIDIADVLAAHQPESLATLVVSERKTQRYFVFDNALTLRGWTNIATGETKPTTFSTEGLRLLAFSGMHVVSPRIFEQMQSWPDRFPIVDFYLSALQSNTIKAYVPTDYRMMDIGKIDHLSEAEEFAREMRNDAQRAK